MKDNIKLTFDKSAAKFVIESFGNIVARNGTNISGGLIAKCYLCGSEMNIENLAGFINWDGEPSIICNGIECILKLADHTKEVEASDGKS